MDKNEIVSEQSRAWRRFIIEQTQQEDLDEGVAGSGGDMGDVLARAGTLAGYGGLLYGMKKIGYDLPKYAATRKGYFSTRQREARAALAAEKKAELDAEALEKLRAKRAGPWKQGRKKSFYASTVGKFTPRGKRKEEKIRKEEEMTLAGRREKEKRQKEEEKSGVRGLSPEERAQRLSDLKAGATERSTEGAAEAKEAERQAARERKQKQRDRINRDLRRRGLDPLPGGERDPLDTLGDALGGSGASFTEHTTLALQINERLKTALQIYKEHGENS